MSSKEISKIREDYTKSKIDFTTVPESPFKLFENWFDLALLDDKENGYHLFCLLLLKEINLPLGLCYLEV